MLKTPKFLLYLTAVVAVALLLLVKALQQAQAAPGESPAGVRIARQCTRPFIDQYEQRTDPRGRDYFWNSSIFTLGNTEDDTDVAGLRDRYVTITPLQFDMTHHPMTKKWSDHKWNVNGDHD